MNNLPKSYLLQIILSKCNPDQIRMFFKIKDDTSLEERLGSFSKMKLIDFINSLGGEIKKYAIEEEKLFPIKSSPTLYIINITSDVSYLYLEQLSNEYTDKGRDSSVFLAEEQAVRCVYIRNSLSCINQEPKVYELVLGYEKRVAITEWDPELDEYGEDKTIYSLENALLWFSESNKRYAILACRDFSAVDPIIKFLKNKLSIKASLPDLSQDMLFNLSNGSRIKSATFASIYNSKTDRIDAKTITIYDEDLENKHIYDIIRKQETREQRSGFYNSHPDLLRAGIGITRRYGRVWTPAHLNKGELIRLSLGIIAKLDVELEAAYKNKLPDFIAFYSHIPIMINNVLLTGDARATYDDFIRYIILADRSPYKRAKLDEDFINRVVKHQKKFNIGSILTYECSNCGTCNVKCKTCNINAELCYENDEVQVKCPKCRELIVNSNYRCDCEAVNPILDPISQLFLYPDIELLKSLDDYITSIHPTINNPGLFIIIGDQLVIINQNSQTSARRIYLEDLNLWKTRAHLHTYTASSVDKLNHILGKSREKCRLNNYHPSQEQCDECMKTLPSLKKLEAGDVCLLRAMGIPINMNFDGIHHGHENADIKYTDQLEGNDIKIGIHVKSKSNGKFKNGLGRSDIKVKELYAQLYYSLYKISINQLNFDVLGIGIPNRISDVVIKSISEILYKFGISFIVIDQEYWVKIIGLVIENIENN